MPDNDGEFTYILMLSNPNSGKVSGPRCNKISNVELKSKNLVCSLLQNRIYGEKLAVDKSLVHNIIINDCIV